MVLLSDSPGSVRDVGGKAANLQRLASAGFPVPVGVVVTVEAYDEFLRANKLDARLEECLASTDFSQEKNIDSCSRSIKSLIISATMERSFEQEIKEALRRLDPHTTWAVRSSATAEDLPGASFAGQQDTYLDIPADEVPDRIKLCWASYWNSRALRYRTNAGLSHLEGGAAVVIQKMVDARSAGVMFTTDPASPSNNRIVIEASWGLGEAIVSGMVSPDRFIVDKSSGEIIARSISKKEKGVFMGGGRGTSQNIEPEKQSTPSLKDPEIRRLADVGNKVEELFGKPQDIEWAIGEEGLFLLQSRPITTLEADGETLWTRAYGDEYWADVTSPLFYSLLGDYLTRIVNWEGSRIMGYKQLTGKELLRVHKGHVYFNCEVLEEVFSYNPRFSRTKELLTYFPAKDQERIANRRARLAERLIAELRIAILDPDGMILKTDKAYKRWASRFLEQMRRFDALDLSLLKDQELISEFRQMELSYLKHYRLIRYGMVTHSIGTNLMVKRWLEDWLGDRSGAIYSKLLSGLPANKTIQTNMAIWRLMRRAVADPNVEALLKGCSSEVFLSKMRTAPEMKAIRAEFERFLDEYGHRSHTREIFFPRWRDDPRLVVDVMKSLAASPELDLEALEAKRVEERLRTEKEVFRRIRHLRLGLLKLALFRMVLKYAQIYHTFRENQRFYLDHQIARQRRLFLEFGRRFAERGILNDPTDVFFLSKEEIFDVCTKGPPHEVAEKVKVRRAEFEQYRNLLPPKFLRGRYEFDDFPLKEMDGLRLTGTSVSPGVVTGSVRVVSSIEHLSELQKGEILVASNTDPGWTAVFSKLGGLITETGGILSHGAVVSREYGIPAVTAVKNATGILCTGQRITLNGDEGTIYVHEE